MEKKSGHLVTISGIIRLVVFILALAAIVILGVRFVKNRNDTKNAQKASQVATKKDESSSSNDTSKSSSSSDSSDKTSGDIGSIPSGVADSSAESAPSSSTKVPSAGMDVGVLWVAIILGIGTYIACLSFSLKKRAQ